MAFPRPACLRGAQVFGRAAYRRAGIQATKKTFQNTGRRTYASAHEAKEGSDIPWLIGSLVVTVPAATWLLNQAPEKSAHHGQEEDHGDAAADEDGASKDEGDKDSGEDQQEETKDEASSDSKEDSKAESKAESKDDPKAKSKEYSKAESRDDSKPKSQGDSEAESKPTSKSKDDSKEKTKGNAESSDSGSENGDGEDTPQTSNDEE